MNAGSIPKGLPHAISRLAKLVTELAGGTVKGAQAVRGPSRAWVGTGIPQKKISVKPQYFADFLGMVVSPAEAEKVLLNHDCKVDKSGDDWTVSPPSYRHDLNIPEDLAEEVARSLGYDRILETVPVLDLGSDRRSRQTRTGRSSSC